MKFWFWLFPEAEKWLIEQLEAIKEMNSKGTIMDAFGLLLILFICAVLAVILYFVTATTADTGILGGYLVNFRNFIGAFALGLPIGVAGLIVVASILAYYVRAHPAYLFLALIIVIFGFPISVALSAVWNDFEAGATAMASTFTDLALLSTLMQNLPWVWLGAASLIMISAYMGYQRG